MPYISSEFKFTRRNAFYRRATVYLLDLSAFALSGYLAFQLRFDGQVPGVYSHPMKVAIGVWMFTQAAAFLCAREDRGNWRHVSIHDAVRIAVAVTIASVCSVFIIAFLLGRNGEPRSVYFLNWMMVCLLTLGMRFFFRILMSWRVLYRSRGTQTRTLIYGAGAAGLALLWELRQNEALHCDVVGFIDDDMSKAHLRFQGKPVLGTGEMLDGLVRKHTVEKVLIAMPSATGPQMAHILKYVVRAGVEYKTVPGLAELIEGAELGRQIRPVAVDDLLGRQPVQLNLDAIRGQIQGKVILVTGAAGSIGSELCRQIAHFRPRSLVGFDIAETPLFHLDRELKKHYTDLEFDPVIGDVRRQSDLMRVMEQFRPAVVLHAAAYKHVPLMERYVLEAAENNILGTWNAATSAAKCGVGDFVLISTDKAVRPSSVMGATKRIAELVTRAMQEESRTRFVVTRFGNVLGSNGSVVPIFKEQIAAGGPITVTHPDITRYFMTIPEASQLVLQAFSLGLGGEIFVLDMGEPVKIVDLARHLIVLSGLTPERDIQIQYSGLRPGEKLYEELSLDDEVLVPTAHSKIRAYKGEIKYDCNQVSSLVADLRQILSKRDSAGLMSILREMIPDYMPGEELQEVPVSSQKQCIVDRGSEHARTSLIAARSQ